MADSLNDKNWQQLFDKYKIADKVTEEGFFEITSTQINKFREARLMTKFDYESQLPKPFADRNLSILPISRGAYVIGEFETFYKFKQEKIDVLSIAFPTFLESLDYKNITSESTTINCAFVSKILHHFTEEEELYPTVSGRMGSGAFSFGVNAISGGQFQINVQNSQIEIDGGYEGDSSLILIEAKNNLSNDFLIRQLYYPYRLWNNKIHKRVRSIFLTYTNGVFHLREYDFTDTNHYNSIVCVKNRKYTIQENGFSIEILSQILDKTEVVKEPYIPFPQADSFERIINLCEILQQQEFITKEEITRNYDFDKRQTYYYTSACLYLGIIKTRNHRLTGQKGYCLSDNGKRIFSLHLDERQKEFTRLIISHSVFKKTLEICLKNGEMPAKETIVEIMQRYGIYKVHSDKTYLRRASTVASWINWIAGLLDE